MGLLLLVRHGQASLGAEDYDVLSSLGIRQAGLTAERLARADLRVTSVACGAMVRHRDTALPTAAALGFDTRDLEVDNRLDEYDHDSVMAGSPGAPSFASVATPESARALQTALDEAIAKWMSSGTGYPESHGDFTGRVIAAVDALGKRSGTTVAVTSAGVIAVAVAHAVGLPTDQWPRLARLVTNASVTKLIYGRTGTYVLTFNDHAHLEHGGSLVTYR